MTNFIIKFFLLIFLIQPLLASELIKIEPKDNMEFQDSAFVKLMNYLNNGKIPYPFSDLLDSFKLGIRENGSILFIPKGRSLVKEYADFRNPRIIVDVLSRSPNAPETDDFLKQISKISDIGFNTGELFLGFAPNHKALEIISYNKKKGTYDFFVVEDYEAGKTPRLVSNPALCLSCHQNKAPLFSREPWGESLGELTPNTLKLGFQSPDNHIMDLIIKENPDRSEIEGIKLKSSVMQFGQAAVFGFDRSVRFASNVIFKRAVCQSLCQGSEDFKCQIDLLNIFINNLQPPIDLKNFSNLEKKIFAIDLKTSFIPNRNPFTNTGFKVMSEDHKSDITFTEVTSAGEGGDGIPVLDKSFFDPATPRPSNSKLIELKQQVKKTTNILEKIKAAAKTCLERDPDQIFMLSSTDSFNLSDIEKKNIFNSPSVKIALEEWPNSNPIFSAIGNEVKKIKKIKMLEPPCELAIINALPVFKYSELDNTVKAIDNNLIQKPQALFQKYCIQCHEGPNAFIKLPIDSLEKMANYIPHFSDKGVRERLEKKIMPPSFATLQPTDKERLEMIKVVKELKK
ncbi:MAG: hypothetical protein Q7U04_06820 [Bacteriovorax sp.]|nr:hypothetical protein [Bacteriovorax sp.]